MPIHDLSYQHWTGEWTSHPYRWWIITRQGIVLLAKKKLFLLLLFVSMVPFLVRCVLLYIAVVMGKVQFIRIDARFFEGFLTSQMYYFAFFVAIFSGAGLIANDLKANALQIYLAKAITRRDYLIGKLGVVAFFLSLVTLVPGILLFLVAAAFHSDLEFLRQNGWILLPVCAYSLVIISVISLVVLALSSLNRSSRFAGIFFAAVIFFSQMLYGILSEILRTRSIAWVSLISNLTVIGDALFGNPAGYPVSAWTSALILGSILAGSILIIHNRVRAVEVIK